MQQRSISVVPGTILGFRKDGRPIYPIAGGDGTAETPPPGDTLVLPDLTPQDPPAPPKEPRTFSVDDIEKARKEEKDKLYSELDKRDKQMKALQDELAKIAKAREDEERARQEAKDKAEADAKKKFEDEASAKELLKAKEEEWNNRFEQLQQERESERALLDKERRFTQLQSYIQRRVAEEASNQSIAPQLLDLVSGNSEDEVEQSIALYQQKTLDIVESVKRATTVARSQQRGVSPAGYATTGPTDNEPGTRQYTAEELKNMPMSEYARLRQHLPGVGSASQNNRGMFV